MASCAALSESVRNPRSQSSTSRPSRRAGRWATPSARCLSWREAPRRGATGASGWPSTTTCRASPARRPRCSPATSRAGRNYPRRLRRRDAAEPRAARHRDSSCTLESLYPGSDRSRSAARRARDPQTMRALRRKLVAAEDDFARDVAELLSYFAPVRPVNSCAPCPAQAQACPSGCSAQASTARGSRR